MSNSFTQDFRTQRRNYDDGLTRIGEKDRLWYEPTTNTIRISDGVTPGGIVVGGIGGSGPATTDQLPEGINNLYYTDQRVSDFLSTASIDADTLDGLNSTDFATAAQGILADSALQPNDNISALINDANYITLTDLSAAGDLVYDNTTGVFSVNTYKSTDFDTDFSAKTTDDLSEGTVNLYFTDGRVSTVINDTSISELLDVDSNLVINLAEDSILIYNANNNEFIAESFLAVLERLKAELEVQYDKLVDEDGTFTYIGEAEPGTAPDAALWRIKRVSEAPDGDLEILWANGTAAFDKIWTDRATFSY